MPRKRRNQLIKKILNRVDFTASNSLFQLHFVDSAIISSCINNLNYNLNYELHKRKRRVMVFGAGSGRELRGEKRIISFPHESEPLPAFPTFLKR